MGKFKKPSKYESCISIYLRIKNKARIFYLYTSKEKIDNAVDRLSLTNTTKHVGCLRFMYD
jgi:hypothetical protein